MATITPKLTITSTTAVTGETLNISVDDQLTVVSPIVGLSVVDAEVTGGSVTAIKPSGAANQYVYVKHTGYQADGTSATTNQLVIKFASTESLRLAANEFAFFPCKSDVVVNIISSSTQVVKTEYAYWTAG
tara:strand:+ start:121 stop:513 length:393 start_codon:yes stop_codon:yes gene_type:complete